MLERAINSINSNNSLESGARAGISFLGMIFEAGVSWANVPFNSEVWWLKLLTVAAVSTPLGALTVYQAGRSMFQAENELIDSERRRGQAVDQIHADFKRIFQG